MPNDTTDYPRLLEFCANDSQRELLQAIIDVGTIAGATRKLGRGERNAHRAIKSIKKRAAKQGYSPDHDMTRPAPEGYSLRGTSTYYDEDGNIKGQWVKTQADREAQESLMREAVESMCESVKRTKPIKPPKQCYEKLMTAYPMGDPHFGMYSWAAETGNDFDVDIAEKELYAAVDYLVSASPPSHRGVLINLGDFFHAENMEGITTAHGNVLDMDTRFPRMIDIGVRALRRCVERMLEKHQQVEIINAPGNHDTTLAFFMNTLFRNVYENETRVKVYDEPTVRHYILHGKCLIGIVHGHQTKDRDLPGIMATERPKQWGETKFRHFFRGHHHQDALQEFNGCKVEQFRTLAPGDAYAVGRGYLSGSDMKAIVFHEDFGEQTRFTCGIDVLRGEA